MYTHVYIKAHQAIRMFTYKNTCIRRPMQHLGTKNGLTSLYTTKKDIHHAPLMVPLSHHHLLLPQAVAAHHHLPQAVVVHPLGPSCPGGRRPLVIAASTAARRTMDRHGGGTPTHCSRKLSSWMRVHMPSGTSCKTVSRRRRISSKSTPAAAGGACDGPAPGSSNRHLLAALSGSAGHPATSSRRRLSPCGSLSGSRRADALCISTSRPRGATSAHAKKQQIVSTSISYTYGLLSQKTK
jgi:hypothetical protein